MIRTLHRVAASVGALALIVTGGALAAATAHAADAVPYTDAKAVGYIGLCDKAGKQVQSGSVETQPFVWRAVSSVKAPPGYDGKRATAALYAYQPRKGVDAAMWSGDLLTASATYSNPLHPMAASTDVDLPLMTNLDAYPADWDGYYQLRMYLSAPGQTPYQVSYAATDIKVTGTTWTVVRGGSVDCNSGTAVSSETEILGKAKTAASASAAATPTPTTTGSATASTSSAEAAAASPSVAGGADAGSTPVASTSSSSDTNTGALVLALVLVAAALLGGGTWFWFRRKEATP